MGRVAVFICATLLLLSQHRAAAKSQPQRKATVHTVITTECTPYFDWQILGLVYSYKRAKQPGSFTRLLSCTDEQLQNYKGLDLVPTHVVPSLTMDPNKEHNDHYSAYNKPGAVLFWLQDVEPEEDYILVIDADMIFRSPFIPEQMGVSPGAFHTSADSDTLQTRTARWAVSAYFGYLKGVKNELALKHVPYVEPRNDTLAGPEGRRGDQVGGFCIMHKEDLKRVAPLWLKFSKAVRHDPDAWNLTGDAFTHNPGDKPWISEMYGYSFGTASANVWHHVDYEAMLYPGYTTYVPPKVLHYGLHWEVGKTGYEFDKHWFYDFDALQCPPWNLTGNSRGGLFRHPPHPATYPTKGFDLLVDMLAAEPMIVLNAAFCELHRKRCPPSEQLMRECSYAEQLMRDFDSIAVGLQDRCPKWAGNNECVTNPSWMKTNCRLSCGTCPPKTIPLQGDGTGQGHQLLLGGERRMVGRGVTSDVATFLHHLGWVGGAAAVVWHGCTVPDISAVAPFEAIPPEKRRKQHRRGIAAGHAKQCTEAPPICLNN
ncbi:hypothetical protein COCSUDRAFT_40799 [Coccomyxa subellipsoidea C-169]|uniref:ShKT domain-containing protein n=1 Tax=Coccomyxa subellipsoidea (strain C-169) TaxID=574566 RepID=I0Z167_COCSC|nr:hypothetical protein COCSUDRAFT_40799 [Coccomyxa subellipsoidea C-169]EIE24386.1 hypothetical protein COCSUDRAFT_40799 [Coccomyxa subellipsoidea C-169]|eukprot:XP_005648930.1 hypothetical protein COCSUDRAFT_40799 [Coccomyxa subellipsoidea C-169]